MTTAVAAWRSRRSGLAAGAADHLQVCEDGLLLALRVELGDELLDVIALAVRLFGGIVGEPHQMQLRHAVGLPERLVAKLAGLVGHLGHERDDRSLRRGGFGGADAEPRDAVHHRGLPGMRRIWRACAGVATSRPAARASSAILATSSKLPFA